jgi:hypothetical protein
MTGITEIENFAIELLELSCHQYFCASNSDVPKLNRFEDVLLLEHLQSAVCRITQNKAKTIDSKDDQGINKSKIHTQQKLRDTLLPKLLSKKVRITEVLSLQGKVE